MALRRANFITADVANATTTLADVTGLSMAVNAGVKYWFRYSVWYTVSATTVGLKLSVSGPASPTALTFTTNVHSGAAARALANATAYDAGTSSPGASVVAGNVGWVEGYIIPLTSGSLIARFAADSAGTATVKAGSKVEWHEA